MGTVKIVWWNLLTVALASALGTVGLEKIENSRSTSRDLDVFRGFRLTVEDDELRVKINLEDMFPVTAVQSRADQKDDPPKDDKNNPSNVEKLGSMMMMIPLTMQMMSIPAAIASIKMSLLKSILVAKLALILMLYNFLRNQKQTKAVVLHEPAHHHDHFYSHHTDEASEEHDQGWFG